MEKAIKIPSTKLNKTLTKPDTLPYYFDGTYYHGESFDIAKLRFTGKSITLKKGEDVLQAIKKLKYIYIIPFTLFVDDLIFIQNHDKIGNYFRIAKIKYGFIAYIKFVSPHDIADLRGLYKMTKEMGAKYGK
jgi:hypothetical protein